MSGPYRTTNAEVRAIMDSVANIPLDSNQQPDFSPFIVVANELTTELCSGSGYSDTRLALIETWLAAHAACCRQRQLTEEHVGAAGQTYEEGRSRLDVSAGLASTRYGAMAITLDTASTLLRSAYRQGKGLRKGVLGIYGGSRVAGPSVNPDFDEPGFYPG